MADVVKLADLTANTVPEELRADYYFDFAADPFAHAALLAGARSVVHAISGIGAYAKTWLETTIEELGRARSVRTVTEKDYPARSRGRFRALLAEGAEFDPAYVIGVDEGRPVRTLCLAPDARFLGAVAYLTAGDVYLGAETVVEPSAGVAGPGIVMEGNAIRQGAYLRENVIIGAGGGNAVYRGEFKNAVIMNEGSFPHPSYVGDSIMGAHTHFGNGVTAANFGIFQGLRARAKRRSVVVRINGVAYDLGLTKMGVVMGDYTQIGCNSVISPGTLIGKRSVAYALCMIERGFYPGGTILKNKPIAGKVIEVGRVDPDRI
ncbi:MAG: hypothetical protein JXR37_24550 [Kiritimatiellae bacterium]|nr:hypothetical protein [Kiritimatiellia bacterium]